MKKNIQKQIEKFQKLTEEFINKPFKVQAEEGYSRQEYVNDLCNLLIGSSFEFLKCQFHDKLDLHSEFREKWEKEWRYILLYRFVETAGHKIKFSNRDLAIEQAIKEFFSVADGQITRAGNTIARYHQLKPRDVFGAIDTKEVLLAFYGQIKEALSLYKKQEETSKSNKKK